MAFNLAKCNYCGACFESCPYTDYDKKRSAEQVKKLVRGEEAEIISECITCAACNSYCTRGANPFDLLLWRQELTGLYKTSDSYKALVDSIDEGEGNIVKGKTGKPVVNVCVVDVIPGVFEGRLFEGCTFLKGGEYESCLGCIHIGTETPLREKLPQKINALSHAGFSEIVMFHDDCYSAYTTKALEYNIDVPFKVKHYVQYLKEYLELHKDEIKPLKLKIAYQQPCSSRYTPWIDSELDELFNLCGAERVPRKYDRLNALCCGSPIGPHLGSDACGATKQKNIDDAINYRAEAMVFMCPFCALQMREEVAAAGMEPIFLTNLVRKALGEELSSHPAGLGDNREEIQTVVKIIKGYL